MRRQLKQTFRMKKEKVKKEKEKMEEDFTSEPDDVE